MKTQNKYFPQSAFFPVKVFLSLILTVSLLCAAAYSAEVTLQWDPNTEPDLAGYKIYYDSDSGAPYEGTNADQGGSPIIVAVQELADPDHPQYTITGLAGSQDYHFAVTAYDAENPSLESGYSDEVIVSTYTINSSAGQNGTVSPDGSVSLSNGVDQTFTFFPDTGYHIENVLVDGYSVGAVSSYTFTNIVADHTITVSFAVNSYTITASADSNGTISPSGSVSTAYGSSRTYTVTPDFGFHIADVQVDGASVGAVSSYTFTNIVADHTITAVFAVNSYTITASAGSNGAISPSGSVSATYGTSRTFAVTPNTGYHIANVLVDGSSVGAVSSYTFNSITANHSIIAIFTVNSYTITASAGSNGAVSPSGSVSETYGTSRTFTVTPNTGYHIENVLVDGSSIGTVSSYTFNNITANHTISATFTINSYTITASAGSNGAISPSGSVSVNHGGSRNFTVTSNTGYHIEDILVDGSSVGVISSYTFNDITANHSISATFEADNQPPVADAGPDQLVDERSTVTLSGLNSDDPDDGIARFSWLQIQGTPVELSNPNDGETTFIAPDVSPDGETLVFQLTAEDYSGAQTSDTCIVNVSWVNIPPTANAGPDQSANEGETVVLNGSASFDEDDGIASYQWEQTYGTPVVISDPTSDKPTFTAPNNGVDDALRFRLTVTDHNGLQAQDGCIVNVLMLNEPPVANAGPNQEVEEGATVVLHGENSTDPDDGILSYQWTQLSGTPVTFSDPGAAITEFIAPEAITDMDFLTFELTVTDQKGLKSTATCSVGVRPIVENDSTPPEIFIEMPFSGTYYETNESYVTISGHASDNVAVSEVSWNRERGEGGTASGTENWEIPMIRIKPKLNTITITATDTAGNSTSKTINIYRRTK